jgi:hypothetical protein
MARYTPTIPIATISGGDPELTIKDDEWDRIQAAYQNTLPTEIRRGIHEATLAFLNTVESEYVSEPISAALERVNSIRLGAAHFKKAIFYSPPNVGFDAKIYADRLIKNNFHDSRLSDRNILDLLGRVMTSVIVACARAADQINSPKNHGRRKGDGWQNWIRNLDLIVKEARLPFKVRKDASKYPDEKHSEYVELIWELQKLIPTQYRRSSQSKAALAKAVWDARQLERDAKSPKTSPKQSRKSTKK